MTRDKDGKGWSWRYLRVMVMKWEWGRESGVDEGTRKSKSDGGDENNKGDISYVNEWLVVIWEDKYE